MLVVGLNGLIGCGKSAVAEYLIEQQDFVRVKFAHPLKEMARALFRTCDLDSETIERMIEGDLKETPSNHLGGQTPRWAMQSLGTEWGRECIAQRFWVRLAADKVRRLAARGQSRFVLDDCRFPNEAEAIQQELGGLVWRIVRPGLTAAAHKSESEQSYIMPDRIIVNNGTLQDLRESAEAVLCETLHG